MDRLFKIEQQIDKTLFFECLTDVKSWVPYALEYSIGKELSELQEFHDNGFRKFNEIIEFLGESYILTWGKLI